MTTERVEHMAGGQGHTLVKRLLDEKQLNGKCKLYAQVTLEPGCSLGYHEHHGESEKSQELGLKIIGFMRKKCDEYSKQYNLNFTCLATPAEGLSGRFVRIDRAIYGKIKGVTDRDYYTNSFHVPVYYNITVDRKIKLEAPYHALTNAGHISYIELDGDPSENLDAFEKVVRIMKESGIGYGAINHPVDRDPVCGYVGVIKDVCPRCGRREGEAVSLEKITTLNCGCK